MEEALFIDCDADPVTQEGETVVAHARGDALAWRPDAIELWQPSDGEALEARPALNVNALWFLVDHRELIPKEWKDGRSVCFLGTTFTAGLAGPYCYCLAYGERGWDVITKQLSGSFGAHEYVALKAA